MSESGRVAIFSPRVERLNLALPAVFALALGASKLMGFTPDSSGHLLLRQIAAYAFLNTTHVGFTFLMFLILPEARQLLAGAIQRRQRWPFVVLAFTFAMMALGYAQDSGVLSLHPTAVQFVFAVLLGLSYQHILAQIFGFSMLYNAAARRSRDADGPQASRLNGLEKIERQCFRILLALVLISPLVVNWVAQMAWILFSAEGLLMLTILVVAWQVSGMQKSGKFLYLCRLPFWLFAGPTIYGDVVIRSLHGLEYLFITNQMIGASVQKRHPLWNSALWAVALVAYPLAVYSLLGDRHWLSQQGWPALVPLLLAVVPFLEYVHYYLDGVLFRFKDVNVRRLIGPLLLRPHP